MEFQRRETLWRGAGLRDHLVPLTFEHNNVKKSVDVVTNKSGTFNMGVATAEVIIEQSV